MKSDAQIEEFIREAFEKNFEQLRHESGHSLSARNKQTALNQALLYWRKLKDIANRITETEVRLNLPGQTTPGKRTFGIEGVVDIVREGDKVVMYDIKTHNAADVYAAKDDYERQLNIYAHIWQNLRGQPLDEIAIIATAYPDELKDAMNEEDEEAIFYELERWNPIIEFDVNPEHVEHIIYDFGRVVDCIENGEFEPAPVRKLKTSIDSKQTKFAAGICRNCDARFSCEAYRRYVTSSRSPRDADFKRYLDDYGTELDQQEWLSSELEASSTL